MTSKNGISLQSQKGAMSIADKLSRIFPGGFVEIEFKLMGTPSVLRDISRSSWILAMMAEPLLREPMVTHYYDTSDFKFHNAGLVLRVRWNGDKWVQSLKARATAHHGLFRRMEWQQPIPTEHPDLGPLLGNEGVLSELAVSSDRVTRVFSTRFERTTMQVTYPMGASSANTRFLLSLDNGQIEAGSLSQPISEVELELIDGPESGLRDFSRTLCQRFTLAPGTLSKADRGYRLVGADMPAVEAALQRSLGRNP